MTILSGDPPRGRALQILIVLIVLALALAPFLFPGVKALNTAAKTCVMILLVASYDVLLGYSGIVSFTHVMFFGASAPTASASASTGSGRAGARSSRASSSLSRHRSRSRWRSASSR